MTQHTHIDRGGTFTDVVYRDADGAVTIRKVPSNTAVMGRLSQGALTLGTTVATNALLQRRGVRVALFVTQGFADLPWIRDQTRPDLFDLNKTWPAPQVERDLVIEVGGRIDRDGLEVEPLRVPDIDPNVFADIDVACIVLVNSHVNPDHERRLAAALPMGFITLGHHVSPGVGYLARLETALVDAAITPILHAALRRDEVPDDALAMRSDGSLVPAATLRAPDAVLSGPAGGVIAVEAIARQAGFSSAVGLDMGGTSTDVCRVDVGALPRREGTHIVAGVRLDRPALEVETIAAGGGSVLRHDGRQLTVGPDSAGADPGPQAYGHGGPPTLTDAAFQCGLIDPARFPLPLDLGAIDLPAPAEDFLAVARDAMAHAIRRLATARGVDLAGHALVAYGGASGQHAAGVAERLGIRTVLIHPCASVLCAWGHALARREATAFAPLWRPLATSLPAAHALARDLLATLDPLDEQVSTVDIRPEGTDHTIAVDLFAADQPEDVAARYAPLHAARYGVAPATLSLEIADVRVRTRQAPRPPEIATADPWDLGDRPVAGPTRISSDTTAITVPAGWSARWHRGLLWLEQTGPPVVEPAQTTRTPLRATLWGNRFQAVASEAGTVLERLAQSVNIRERRDYSCAIFDETGQLVANAPHIPVHLGAMGETVRDLLRHAQLGERSLDPGQAWVCNDPAAGGSHLPDLTVTTVVTHQDRRFFVASRGHHVDVGGLTPGSMPPHSTALTDEGVVLQQVPLVDAGGRLREDALRHSLAGTRQPDVVIADLRAQLAANAHASKALCRLGSAEVVAAWMGHLRDVAREATAAALAALVPGEAEDTLDGIPLRLALRKVVDDAGETHLIVDFTGTGGPHPGNLNAPPAVVRAAVLYGLRVLVGAPIPLNEGCLDQVTIKLPSGSVLSAPPGAAVVGGNVETSQRLVDLFFKASGVRAASAGTMANLTLGSAPAAVSAWSLYETLGGGLGATRDTDGIGARQTHMTNTRATDVEVVEARLPLRVRSFSIRLGTGGAGTHRGGDGLTREIEVLTEASAALLAAWRASGAQGHRGGHAGARGYAEVCRDGVWEPWPGNHVALAPGDRVRVHTPGGGGWGRP